MLADETDIQRTCGCDRLMGISVALIQSPVREGRSNKGDPLVTNTVKKLKNHARRTDRPATKHRDHTLTLLPKTCVSVDNLLPFSVGCTEAHVLLTS